METKMENWPLLTFKEYEKDINLNPHYQRSAVWKKPQKQMLMDSILRNIDIPKIYLREVNKIKYSYEIIDGQQRMRAIWDFLNNSFPLDENIKDIVIKQKNYNISGNYYDDLDNKVRIERIHKYSLHVVLIMEATENEIADLFFRLNNGTPLSSAEVRNSMPGRVTTTIRKIATSHLFFTKVNISDLRFAHHQICAQMMMLELNSGLADTQNKFLSEMYREYQKEVPKWAVNNIKKTLNTLNKLFPDKSKLLNRASTINLYLLISYLLKTTKLNAEFYNSFLEWFQKTEPERRKDDVYKLHMTSSVNSRKSIENRFRILVYDFYKKYDSMGLIQLHHKRFFDDKQKIQIYADDNGICQICSKKVPETNWHADHKVPWIKGGKTKLSNGQVLCVKCNLEKGDKLWN